MDFSRYQRQLLLPQMDQEKQKKLFQARVLVVGVGGLGCPVLTTLTTSGVGHLGMVDFDTIALSNLHRQFLFSEKDIGKLKTEVAKTKLSQLNSQIAFKIFSQSISIHNAFEIIEDYDVVVDCTDNFPTRYLLNDVCFVLKKPLVYAAIYQNEGQLAVFNHFLEGEDTATNLRDIFPEQPKQEDFQNCNEAGVLGVLTAIMGNFQANEVIKLIIGNEELYTNKLLLFNSLNYQTQTIQYSRNRQTNHLVTKEKILSTSYGNTCTAESNIRNKKELETHLLEAGSILVDVRDENETPDIKEKYNNVIKIPLKQMEQRKSELEPFSTLIFVCASGIRSKKALSWAQDNFLNKKMMHIENGLNMILP